MDMSPDINYAKPFGFESLAAATIFAVLYVLLFIWFFGIYLQDSDYWEVFSPLSLFCAIRATAFIIRMVVIGSDSAGRHFGLLVGANVLFDGVAFPALLFPATLFVVYRLSGLDYGEHENDGSTGAIGCLTIYGVIPFAMIAATMFGAGGVPQQSSDPHAVDFENPPRKASAIILFVLTVLQACETVRLTRLTRARVLSAQDSNEAYPWTVSPETKYECYTICVISLLLLIHEAFATALAMGDTAKLLDERLWYPFIALPEILVVAFFVVVSMPKAAYDRVNNRLIAFFSWCGL
ncbi:hypothetical protein BD779DRAFT_290970 [Infundibulicybe gibba]|nr:hypothetical protein BD779DRAFT_290970 [Infundibulicybe gibba]